MRMSNPCLLMVLWTVFQWTGRLNWCLILRAPQRGNFCLRERIRCSIFGPILCFSPFGPGLLGLRDSSPPSLCLAVHLLNVLAEILYILLISSAEWTFSSYNMTAFALISIVAFTTNITRNSLVKADINCCTLLGH